MSDLPPAVRAALAAARAGDAATLDALVDWPLSAVGAVLRRLADVDPADRGAVTRRALAELTGTDPATRSAALRPLVTALATADRVEPVDGTTRAAVLAAIGAPAIASWPSDGLDPGERAALADLAQRAHAVVDTYAAIGPDSVAMAFAVRPDGQRLVVPPP